MTEEKAKPGMDEMFCTICGAIIKQAAEICPKCGVRVAYRPVQPGVRTDKPDRSERSRVAAGVLGILLGWLGVHRFYLGYVGIGIAQIIVTIVTLGFGGLWGFIEGIIILTNGKFKDADRLPLSRYNE